MQNIAVQLKLLNLYSHLAHNLVAHATFLQDHDFLGSLYEMADGHYDAVIERMIGKGMPVDIVQINVQAVVALKKLPQQVKENKEYFSQLANILGNLQSSLEVACKEPSQSEGIRQLLGGMADQYEGIQYKIGQRLK
jgi:DNA-binding ferritin-like protein